MKKNQLFRVKKKIRVPNGDEEGWPLMYYVYENDKVRRAVAHEGTCSDCNHGTGRNGTRLPHSRWWGPFRDRAAANAKAAATGKATVKECGHCLG